MSIVGYNRLLNVSRSATTAIDILHFCTSLVYVLIGWSNSRLLEARPNCLPWVAMTMCWWTLLGISVVWIGNIIGPVLKIMATMATIDGHLTQQYMVAGIGHRWKQNFQTSSVPWFYFVCPLPKNIQIYCCRRCISIDSAEGLLWSTMAIDEHCFGASMAAMVYQVPYISYMVWRLTNTKCSSQYLVLGNKLILTISHTR